MRGPVIFFAIIFVILLVGISILYFYFEKPAQNELTNKETTVTFNIYATDNGKYVKTPYIITVDGLLHSSGETLIESPIVEEIRTNKTIIIYNKNKDDMTYYTTIYKNEILNKMPPQRVELKLIKPGILSVSSDKKLGEDTKLFITLESTENFNKPYLCIKWSSHIITVGTIYEEVPKLERYELYDRCYDMDRQVFNETFMMPITYKSFGVIDGSDFIKLAFIDRDCPNNICTTFSKNDKNESIDIGAKDVFLEIKK